MLTALYKWTLVIIVVTFRALYKSTIIIIMRIILRPLYKWTIIIIIILRPLYK